MISELPVPISSATQSYLKTSNSLKTCFIGLVPNVYKHLDEGHQTPEHPLPPPPNQGALYFMLNTCKPRNAQTF